MVPGIEYSEEGKSFELKRLLHLPGSEYSEEGKSLELKRLRIGEKKGVRNHKRGECI